MGLGFGVWGLEFGVRGLEFGVWGVGFRVCGGVSVTQNTHVHIQTFTHTSVQASDTLVRDDIAHRGQPGVLNESSTNRR